MADELGAVRRTARPTGDRQTPETAAQESAGTTQILPEGKETDPPLSTRERLAELIAATDRHMAPEDFAEPRLAARAHATAILAAGWRPPRPFEAPLAVHFAGPYVTIGGRRRQLCAWCGHVLLDVQLAPGQEHEPWFDVKLVRVEDGTTTRQPYTYGDPLPPGCCALPNDELPPCVCEPDRCLGEGDPPNWCQHCATIDGELPCPIADAELEHCGKHTGNCSNRCLLPAHHDGECDDDPHPDEAQETRAAADWPAEDEGQNP